MENEFNDKDERIRRSQLLAVTAIAAEYCSLLETAREMEKEEFIERVIRVLPKLYLEFSDPETAERNFSASFDDGLLPEYVDEDFYEAIRRNVESLLGPDDTFLETFEEDMKYSETPIAASVAECLADIFQPLYNFISVVRESEGDSLEEAYSNCREDFEAYWSQTLCNVMRPLNNIRYNKP